MYIVCDTYMHLSLRLQIKQGCYLRQCLTYRNFYFSVKSAYQRFKAKLLNAEKPKMGRPQRNPKFGK